MGTLWTAPDCADSSAILDVAGYDQQDQRMYLTKDKERLETELWVEPPAPVLEAVATLVTADRPAWCGGHGAGRRLGRCSRNYTPKRKCPTVYRGIWLRKKLGGCFKYGFVSAGGDGGTLLSNINIGDVIFCHIAGTGFVGIATCISRETPANHFVVRDDGVEKISWTVCG